MLSPTRCCSHRTLRVLALVPVLILAACNFHYGLPTPGFAYPANLSSFAPRLGNSGNYIYYPRYEAYYHPSSHQFYYPSGKKWEVQPTVLSSTPKEIFATSSVPFQFAEHPSRYHDMVKQAYPATWTSGKGRYDEPYAFGRSGWDIDRR